MTDPSAIEAAARAALHGRYDQAFLVFSDAERARLRAFGTPCHFRDGDALVHAGQASPGLHVVERGHVAVTTHDGLGQVTPVVELGPGQFLGELSALAAHDAVLVDAHAEGDVETILIPPDSLRALLIAEAVLGERIMRALVLRRVAILEGGRAGAVLIGAPTSPDVIRLQGFLDRNAHPHHLLDPARDPVAAELVARHATGPEQLPLVVCPSGEVLRNPREHDVARHLGMLAAQPTRDQYDVAVVGCGPAGLATAVYAGSEGLSVVVLDARAFGGQAGASARIENYFGFPTGISGQALTGRAFAQARKFGAEILIPVEVQALDCSRPDGLFALTVDSGHRVRARTVVVASGARYRRPDIPDRARFEGRGIWYWASPVEATLAAGQEAVIVGGGNSAGQAAVFLAARCHRVRVMVRGPGLAASMSQYLIDRLAATANIELLTETEITALGGDGDGNLAEITWRSRRTGAETTAPVRHLFLFVGADPATGWLAGCDVTVDRAGFVVTGGPSPLASSVPGVFAVGDVRAGSVKRVGAAIGEGAQVVAAIHGFLAADARPQGSQVAVSTAE